MRSVALTLLVLCMPLLCMPLACKKSEKRCTQDIAVAPDILAESPVTAIEPASNLRNITGPAKVNIAEPFLDWDRYVRIEHQQHRLNRYFLGAVGKPEKALGEGRLGLDALRREAQSLHPNAKVLFFPVNVRLSGGGPASELLIAEWDYLEKCFGEKKIIAIFSDHDAEGRPCK